MGVKDYDLNPDNNTQINGINIAEGCPPSGINNAIRQLMADVKADSDDQNNTASTPATSTSLGPVMPQTGHEDGLELETDGKLRVRKASASQRGGVLASTTAAAGVVPLGGADGTLDKGWFGTLPDDIEVVNSSGDNWIRYESGIQICWGSEVTNASGGQIITLPVSYVNNAFSVFPATIGNSGSLAAQVVLYVERNATTMFTIWAATGGKPAPGVGFSYFTIGRWK